VHTSVNAGVLIILGTSWGLVSLVALSTASPSVDPTGLFLLVAAGVLAPGLGRLAATVGVDRMGPSISALIQGGAYPLFALMGGIALLDEPLIPTRVIGALAIVLGVWQLSRGANTETTQLEAGEDDRGWRKSRFHIDAGFPVIAGLSFAASDVLKKEALEFIPDPLFGAMVASGAAFVAWLLLSVTFPRARDRVVFGKGYWWFLLSGVLVAMALMSAFLALEKGDVSVISAIVASQPLAVLLLSVLFLRDLEKVNATTLLAGTIIVCGTVLVSLQ
jgi:drug/metabolite transporter (DMT)-like permease